MASKMERLYGFHIYEILEQLEQVTLREVFIRNLKENYKPVAEFTREKTIVIDFENWNITDVEKVAEEFKDFLKD